LLSPSTLPSIQRALAEDSLDGWLLFDFHGVNPIAIGMLGLRGMVTRRIFGWIPAKGKPVAITHAIEQGPWREWPSEWGREIYSSWRTLESLVDSLVNGKRIAMEYSPGDAVPYVDRVPAGVLEMVRTSAREVVSSGTLVSQFYAHLSAANIASHTRAAEVIAEVARAAMTHAGQLARSGTPTHEHALQQWILERFARADLEAPDHGPIVAIGPNAANPHYAPSAERSAPITSGSMLLIDLWAREPGGVYADQTWIATLGEASTESVRVWETVRDARDAAIEIGRTRIEAGKPVRGGELDDAARAVITKAGYGEYFVHRTGHSIDAQELHGSGPHIDNLETREERLLIPGVAFSIEPGIYLAEKLGVRSEVNAIVADGALLVTPKNYQRDLLVV
jgi:Xaa-Pro aminopeptidase